MHLAMMHKSRLFFLFGAWLSFVGIIVAGASFLPVTKSTRALSPAAVYRAVANEELRNAETLPMGGKVIAIDEVGMKVSLYENGKNTQAFKIVQLATPFSLYEVPTGSYSVSKKEPQHLSRENGT